MTWDPTESLEKIMVALAEGTVDQAGEIARSEIPFEPTEKQARKSSDAEKVGIFLRDGFIDRYTGKRLVFPGVFRLLGVLLPELIPYHGSWKPTLCHPLIWSLYPTVDHMDPVSFGGEDAPRNLVTTSMVQNAAKGNSSLEQLGWRVQDAGDLAAWDGLTVWFEKLWDSDGSLREQPGVKQWKRALDRGRAMEIPALRY